MDKLREKIGALNLKVDEASSKADEYRNTIKQLEQDNLTKEQEISSLTHRYQVLDDECNKLGEELKKAKESADQGHASSSEVESLNRKIGLLESEAEEAEKNLRETTDRLRQTDVKAEHYERKVATLELEREQWEKRYEELQVQFKKLKEEYDAMTAEIEGM